MGANFFNCGLAGMGQTAKIANNLALAIQMHSICEAMLFGEKMGIDLKILTDIMSKATSKWAKKLLEPESQPPGSGSLADFAGVKGLPKRVHERAHDERFETGS